MQPLLQGYDKIMVLPRFPLLHSKISVCARGNSLLSLLNVLPWVVLKIQFPILVSYIVGCIWWRCILVLRGDLNAWQMKWNEPVSSKEKQNVCFVFTYQEMRQMETPQRELKVAIIERCRRYELATCRIRTQNI